MFNLLMAIVVCATIDSSTIALGEQTNLHLQVKADSTQQVQFPKYNQELIPDIEIVNCTPLSTTQLSDGRVQYDQTFTLTSFSDSLFAIPAIPVCAGTDTAWSDPLSLNVIIPFDTIQMARDSIITITDIKDIQQVSVSWFEIVEWSLLGLLGIASAVGIFFLARFWIRRRRLNTQMINVHVRPADEVAMAQLRSIREAKLWQNGKEKEYHSDLTSVLREYIASRYGIRSSEKTSDETLRDIQPLLASQPELYQNLRKMLKLADLVKFAKWQATPDENESALSIAIDFVVKTSPNTQENGIS